VLGSAAFHALLLLLFVLDLDRGPVVPSIPPMIVSLERAPEAVPPPTARSASQGAAKVPSPAPKTEVAPAAPVAVPAAPALAPALTPALASAPAPASSAAPAPPASSLRGLGKCRLATLDRLSPDERARCQEQLAQGLDGGHAARPNLDPTGRYVKDPAPYLTRPPKDGCKPVGSVKQVLMGQTAVTMAAGCGRSF
jgi:hypothetical protein